MIKMFDLQIKNYIQENYEDMLNLLRKLCLIPAPSGQEEKRAQFCLEYLKSIGAQGAYIDDALNTVFPYNCENSNDITVFVAHTDTVFPDTEEMPLSEDDENIYSPGAGDDTACLCVLLLCARYLIEKGIKSKNGILFVCNSCEEGLGNLKGTKKIMEDYEGRIARFVSFDATIGVIHHECVGSHRYEVEVRTQGGHSFQEFGKENAIANLCGIAKKIYEIDVPKIGNSRTTYNVGTIEGGTSINTIAQNAKMLCEYRSDSSQCLDIMKEKFEKIFYDAVKDGVEVKVKKIGDRPCEKGVDLQEKEKLISLCSTVMKNVTGKDVSMISASTDCNIPLSMGIASVCIGIYIGGGMHTREEWVNKESLKTGLEIGLKTVLAMEE